MYVLGRGDTAVSKADPVLALRKLTFWSGRLTVKQVKTQRHTNKTIKQVKTQITYKSTSKQVVSCQTVIRATAKAAGQGGRVGTGLGVILGNVTAKTSWRMCIQVVLNKGFINTGSKTISYLTNE